MTRAPKIIDANAHAEELINALFPFAEKMLAEHGEFHPFGGYLNSSAEVVHVGVDASCERSSASDKVDVLVGTFMRLADEDEGIAFAIATDVRLPGDDGSKADAIRLFIEHRAGYCADVFFRYVLRDGVAEIAEATAQQGQPMFWRSRSES